MQYEIVPASQLIAFQIRLRETKCRLVRARPFRSIDGTDVFQMMFVSS